jgi:mannose-6-phosphate isomerase-like protein (cupin superfamily)
MAGSMPNFRFRTVDGRIEPMTENEQSHPRRVEKPWGYEIWWAVTDRYVGKILHVNKGERLSLQYHEQKDETCYVLSGSLLLVQGESEDSLAERVVSVGEIWHNAPGVIHTIEAVEDSDVLEASTPFLDDVVRLRDNYGREGTSAV